MEYIPFSKPQDGSKDESDAGREDAQVSDVINTSIMNLDGRYPATGWEPNKDCRTVLYITQRRGRLITHGDTGEISTDVGADGIVILEPNEEYVLEGRMRLFRVMTRLAIAEQAEEADQEEADPAESPSE